MKTRTFPSIAGASLFLGAFLTVQAQIVEIPDPGLQAAIRAAIGKTTGDIMVADMEGLTELHASRGGRWGVGIIRNLDGLEFATNLNSLNLSGSRFSCRPCDVAIETTDFSFLESLSSLTELYLGYNELTNLSLPAGLSSLTRLDLGGNQPTSLSLPALLKSPTLGVVRTASSESVGLLCSSAARRDAMACPENRPPSHRGRDVHAGQNPGAARFQSDWMLMVPNRRSKIVYRAF